MGAVALKKTKDDDNEDDTHIFCGPEHCVRFNFKTFIFCLYPSTQTSIFSKDPKPNEISDPRSTMSSHQVLNFIFDFCIPANEATPLDHAPLSAIGRNHPRPLESFRFGVGQHRNLFFSASENEKRRISSCGVVPLNPKFLPFL